MDSTENEDNKKVQPVELKAQVDKYLAIIAQNFLALAELNPDGAAIGRFLAHWEVDTLAKVPEETLLLIGEKLFEQFRKGDMLDLLKEELVAKFPNKDLTAETLVRIIPYGFEYQRLKVLIEDKYKINITDEDFLGCIALAYSLYNALETFKKMNI